MTARRAEQDALRAAIAEDDAGDVLVLHPRIADEYRKRVRALGQVIARGEAGRTEALARLRELVDVVRVGDAPGEPDNASIEVLGSLAEALSLATQGAARPSRRMTTVVAEERYEHCSPLHSFVA